MLWLSKAIFFLGNGKKKYEERFAVLVYLGFSKDKNKSVVFILKKYYLVLKVPRWILLTSAVPNVVLLRFLPAAITERKMGRPSG